MHRRAGGGAQPAWDERRKVISYYRGRRPCGGAHSSVNSNVIIIIKISIGFFACILLIAHAMIFFIKS